MANNRPYPAPLIQRAFAQKRLKEVGLLLTMGQKGSILGAIENAASLHVPKREVKIARYTILNYLFPENWATLDEVSAKTLINAEWFALQEWVTPWKDEATGKWEHHEALNDEVLGILKASNPEDRSTSEYLGKTVEVPASTNEGPIAWENGMHELHEGEMVEIATGESSPVNGEEFDGKVNEALSLPPTDGELSIILDEEGEKAAREYMKAKHGVPRTYDEYPDLPDKMQAALVEMGSVEPHLTKNLPARPSAEEEMRDLGFGGE